MNDGYGDLGPTAHESRIPTTVYVAPATTVHDGDDIMTGHVVIVGGGVAAMRCAFELREQGHSGRISMVSAESTPPYDRTLVSKDLLSGDPVDSDLLLLQPAEAYADAAIDLRLGARATGLETRRRRLALADGSSIAYDHLVVAVGGEPVKPPDLVTDGVLTVRELGDAHRLDSMFRSLKRVVIIGGGFIGTEIASTSIARGLETTIVDAELPFASRLGDNVAQRISTIYRANGVTLLTGTPVDRVHRSASEFRVELADGRHAPADLVVVAVGMRPATGWLGGSELRVVGGIPVDMAGRSNVEDVYAAGDCALFQDSITGRSAIGEHWDMAGRQGIVVARTLLGLDPPRSRVPYYWSDQFGVKLQMIGHVDGADSVEFEDVGAPHCFIARYRRRGRLLGVFASGVPRVVGQARRELERAAQQEGVHRARVPDSVPR